MRAGFQVAVVGAGYAGLAGALLLGRYGVSTVIFDGGRPRNFMTRRIHGYLGFEGASPSALLGKAWEQVKQYRSIAIVRKKVSGAKRHGDGFALAAGEKTYSARRVVIATGVRDIKPSIENFEKFDGDGAWHCPHCDGHEAAGKRLALIVSCEKPLSYAKEFIGWTRDITIFPQGCRMEGNEKEQARSLGMRVIEGETIVRVKGGRGGAEKQLVCASGLRHGTDVVFYRIGYDIQNALAKDLGCDLDDGYVRTDSGQKTSISNVYAAGDIDLDRHYVALAAAAGARAAISIYEDLLKEMSKVHKSG